MFSGAKTGDFCLVFNRISRMNNDRKLIKMWHCIWFSCFKWFDCKNSQRICGDSLLIYFAIYRSHYNVLCRLRAGRISDCITFNCTKNTMRCRAKDASCTHVPRTNHTKNMIYSYTKTYDIELFCAIILCFPFWRVLLQPSNFVILISSHILFNVRFVVNMLEVGLRRKMLVLAPHRHRNQAYGVDGRWSEMTKQMDTHMIIMWIF